METLRERLRLQRFLKTRKGWLCYFNPFPCCLSLARAGSFVKAVAIQFLLFSLFGWGGIPLGVMGGRWSWAKLNMWDRSLYRRAHNVCGRFLSGFPCRSASHCRRLFVHHWIPSFQTKRPLLAIATICTSLVLQDIFINWKMVGAARNRASHP